MNRLRVVTDRPAYTRGMPIWAAGRVAYVHLNVWSFGKPRLKFVPSKAYQ